MNVIEFQNVWKKFRKGEKLNSLRDMIPYLFRKALPGNNNGSLKREEFWALRDVSFEVKKNDVVGIIGPNGAGKSTALKLLSGILAPNKGTLNIKGRLSALIEVTAGFHPELTGRENVYLNGAILGMKKREIDAKFEEIVDFSGISEFIDTPVKRYSSGMFSRLGFSVAAHMNPDILLVDEVLSVGDIAFQAKCAQKMRELLNSGATIVLVSHNLSLVQSLCKRIILFNRGQIQKEGSAEEVVPYYQNTIYKESEEELKRKINFPDFKVYLNEEPIVKFLNVAIIDSRDKQREYFNTGETISIRIDYEAKEAIENPVFTLEIIRTDGIFCCYSDTKNNGILEGSIQGKNSVNIKLKNMNLMPGVYIAKISIWDRDMIHPYEIRRRDIFKIATKGFDKDIGSVFLPVTEWRKV